MTVAANKIFVKTRNGKADAGQEQLVADLSARLAQPDAKLLLHLHGGLVKESVGLAIAQRLSGTGPTSWQLDDSWTQLYVIWRTSAFETLKANWEDLAHNDRLYQVLLSKLLDYVARKYGIPAPGGGRSIAAVHGLNEAEIRRRIRGEGTPAERRDPFADVEVRFVATSPGRARAATLPPQSDGELALEFQNELALSREFQGAIGDLDNVVNAGVDGRGPPAPGDAVRGQASLMRLDKAVRAQFGPVRTAAARKARGPVSVGAFILKHAGRIAWRCFKRFRADRDHGFHATIVEELARELYGDLIGATIWGMMVKDAADHFSPEGFGTTLIDVLAESPQPPQLRVVGHSAGAIFASRLLLAMEQRGLAGNLRLFLLAPAARQDLFAEVITEAQDRIELCRMFTMTDELERRDAVLGHDKGYIYPSSLLYLVSGLFEERKTEAYPDAPLVGMRRFAAAPWLSPEEAASEAALAEFFAGPNTGVVLSPTPGVCVADCHGCFDEEPHTLASVAALF